MKFLSKTSPGGADSDAKEKMGPAEKFSIRRWKFC